MRTDQEQTLAPCSSCRRETFHDVLHSIDVGDDPNDVYEGPEVALGTYRLIQCKGCGQVSMSHHGQYTDDGSDFTYYPSPVSRKAPAWCEFWGVASTGWR
jgi:hypothetical protein